MSLNAAASMMSTVFTVSVRDDDDDDGFGMECGDDNDIVIVYFYFAECEGGKDGKDKKTGSV